MIKCREDIICELDLRDCCMAHGSHPNSWRNIGRPAYKLQIGVPKPAMPCSVKGVLNTRSRPEILSLSVVTTAAEEAHTKLFCEALETTSQGTSENRGCTHHRAPEHTTERNVLTKHDRIVVFRECDAKHTF